jgi:iron complex outermembrane receptor protein
MHTAMLHRSIRKPLAFSIAAALLFVPSAPLFAQALEEVIVTAQKREVGLQDAPLSITAFTGDSLERGAIQSAEDLARATTGLSFTNPSPFDLELNMRGVMNTRLDAPSASRSVGVFMDEVVVGRMGLMSTDFYDVERVEILRGPQGVLLGKNVVGGAINIITNKPEFETSGRLQGTVGNLSTKRANGYLTGALSESIAARAAFQYHTNDGYAEDLFSQRDLHDINSVQGRLSFLYQGANDLTADLIIEYLEESGNGTCSLGENGNPWAVTRAFLGLTDIRECMPETVQYKGTFEDSLQGYRRQATAMTLRVDKGFDSFNLTSITGYRDGNGHSQYSQTGLGPDAPGVFQEVFRRIAAGNVAGAVPLALAFDFPVNEIEDLNQFSQEIRFTSDMGDSRWDWIAGGYYQKDEVDKFDRFWAEVLANLLNPALGSLNGESTWDNTGSIESYAFFGQLGFQITDTLKFTFGGRYTEDDISGYITGVAVETGDKFSPNNPIPLTPLTGNPGPTGAIVPFPEGGGYSTPYGQSFDETTFQGILEWQVMDDMLWYGSISEGYKSGGFQDTPPNTLGATIAYDPENVINYEMGLKSEFMDGRMRVNGAVYFMDYENLQVEFTNDVCLCNIVSNASDAEIKGFELETQIAATESLYVWASVSYTDTEYLDYVISTGNFSGNQMQRTPETQFNTGFEWTAGSGSWQDALLFRLAYTWQDEMPWAHTNVSWEDSYGLFDGRIALAPQNAAWEVSVWGRNLTDEEYRANVIEFLGGDMAIYNPPRTYGLDVTWKF